MKPTVLNIFLLTAHIMGCNLLGVFCCARLLQQDYALWQWLPVALFWAVLQCLPVWWSRLPRRKRHASKLDQELCSLCGEPLAAHERVFHKSCADWEDSVDDTGFSVRLAERAVKLNPKICALCGEPCAPEDMGLHLSCCMYEQW